MIKTKLTLTLITAFLMMFTVVMVSAANTGDLKLIEISAPSSVNHDDGSLIVVFALKNDGSNPHNDIVWTHSPNIGSWSFSPSLPSTINAGDSVQITGTLTFPAHQSGTIEDDIFVASGTLVPGQLEVDININNDPSLEVSEPTTLTQSKDSTFTIKNTGNTILTPNVEVEDLEYDNKILSFTLSGEGPLQPGERETITVSATVPGEEEALLSGQTTKVKVTAPSAPGITTIEKILTVESSYCEAGNVGQLEIKDIDINNDEGIGDDDEWYLFDKINVDIEVENNADEKIKDVVVEWGLYDINAGEFIFDEKESDFNLDKSGDNDDTDSVTVSFTIDPNDLDKDFSEGDFVLIVKAYSKDKNEENQCVSQTEEDFEIKKESDYVIARSITLLSETIPCNQLLEGDFKVWNIGAEDQENLYVTLENQELGIDERIELGDLEVLDNKKLPFSVKIPNDAVEKSYVLKTIIHEEDGDVFENGDNDDLAEFNSPTFEVSGSCIGASADVEITAILDPETPDAVPGKQIIVKATLRNNRDTEATYTISVEGNSAWSNLVAVDPQVVTIPADGGSQDVNLILSVNSDAEGSKEFTIKATSSDGRTKTQPFGVTVTAADDQAVKIADHIRDNWFIYLIIIVNIILIVAIIIVIRRMVAPAPM